jgi:hypothetical protein
MCRKTVVDVCADAVMLRPSFIEWVNVHGDLTEIAHMMEELMADLRGNARKPADSAILPTFAPCRGHHGRGVGGTCLGSEMRSQV